ncbi:hypothetical protein [Paludisphaera mucosa]|uniref:Uncharacterized protein n=1 Tax=Paludisphaera mucosa TaxID=3030827 RepID=A0ABT6FA73_9BACT|nr:hypothetical protein [Paludisphaera mucosa]MDG3004376.1 hypothetical protein [Paludisphaera mucosa]
MAVVPAELEGMVGVQPTLVDPNTVTMSVVGVAVSVSRLIQDPDLPSGQNMLTPIHTPSRRIFLAELAGPGVIDGRAPLAGFAGATAIVAGDYDTTTKVLTAASVEIEPAENLLAGAVTSVNPLTINEVAVMPVVDARMAFGGFTNEFGFRVTPVAALVGTAASAEGYFVGNTFFAHTVELDASAPLVPGQPPVSLTRSRTRRRPGGPATVDIRGGVDFNALPALNVFQVAIRRVDKNPIDLTTVLGSNLIGIERATRDAAFPRFGLWRLQGRLTQPPEGVSAREPFPLTAPRFIQVFPAMSGSIPRAQDVVEQEADVRF